MQNTSKNSPSLSNHSPFSDSRVEQTSLLVPPTITSNEKIPERAIIHYPTISHSNSSYDNENSQQQTPSIDLQRQILNQVMTNREFSDNSKARFTISQSSLFSNCCKCTKKTIYTTSVVCMLLFTVQILIIVALSLGYIQFGSVAEDEPIDAEDFIRKVSRTVDSRIENFTGKMG